MIDLFPVAGFAVGGIAVALRPRGGDWLDDEIRGLRAAGYSVLVSTLQPAETDELDLGREATFAAAHGLAFISTPIADRGLPDMARAVEVATHLAADVAAGKRVAVHCRQGIGRSSLTVATVLVVGGDDPDVAWSRIAATRGRPVPDTEAQRLWLHDFAMRVKR